MIGRSVIAMSAFAAGLFFVCTLNTYGVVLQDNFDAYTTGFPPPAPWNHREDSGTTVEVDDTVFFGPSGKSVHFYDPGSGVKTELSRGFSQTSNIVLEYYMRSDNQDYEGMFVVLNGDGGSDYLVNFSNGAFGGMKGYIGGWGANGGWVKPDLLAYKTNTWYKVRRELDCTTDTGRFYVWEVDEQHNPIGSPAEWEIGSNYVNTYIDGVFAWSSGSQGADGYIDEIYIVPEPCSLSLLALGCMALIRRRR